MSKNVKKVVDKCNKICYFIRAALKTKVQKQLVIYLLHDEFLKPSNLNLKRKLWGRCLKPQGLASCCVATVKRDNIR